MAVEKRIALFAGIVAAGLVAAFLFPRPLPHDSQPVVPGPTVSFRPPEETPAARSTLLTPVETDQRAGAPTASTQGSLSQLPPLEAEGPPTSGPESPPDFSPDIRPELPRLTDEPLFGEFMEPPGPELSSGPWEQPRVEEALDGLVPVTPRRSSPAERVGMQAVEKPPRVHIVRDGDTLERLARRYLSDADRYREIFELNADTLSSPDVLPLGAKIKIPPRDKPQDRSSPTNQHNVPALLAPQLPTVKPATDQGNPLRRSDPPLEPIRRSR